MSNLLHQVLNNRSPVISARKSSLKKSPSISGVERERKTSFDTFLDANWLIDKCIFFGKYDPCRSKNTSRLRNLQIKKHNVFYLDDINEEIQLFSDINKLTEYCKSLLLLSTTERIFICCSDGYDKSGLIGGIILKMLKVPTEYIPLILTKKSLERNIVPSTIVPTNERYLDILSYIKVEYMSLHDISSFDKYLLSRPVIHNSLLDVINEEIHPSMPDLVI